MIMGCNKKRTKGKVIAGVCSGIAKHTGYNPWIIRLVFIALTVPLTLFVPLFYFACAWFWDHYDEMEAMVVSNLPRMPWEDKEGDGGDAND